MRGATGLRLTCFWLEPGLSDLRQRMYWRGEVPMDWLLLCGACVGGTALCAGIYCLTLLF